MVNGRAIEFVVDSAHQKAARVSSTEGINSNRGIKGIESIEGIQRNVDVTEIGGTHRNIQIILAPLVPTRPQPHSFCIQVFASHPTRH